MLWLLLTAVSAHSWIDSIFETSNPQNIGFPRNYAGHDADVSITTYKVLTRNGALPACGPSQRSASYSARYPELSVSAGSSVTAVYSENGHVTKDHLAPDNLPHPGHYSWYIARSGLNTFADLNANTLLSGPSPFDDGKCAVDAAGMQGRQGPIDCLSTFTIPATLSPGSYQLVWWWDFTKLTAVDPSYTEYYTTCLDINVTPATGQAQVAAIDAAQVPVIGSPAKQAVPLFANVSYVAPQASIAPEADVVVIDSKTTTLIYDHPTAVAKAIAPASMPTPVQPFTTITRNAETITMLVNPKDGSLSRLGSADTVTVYEPVYVTIDSCAPPRHKHKRHHH